MASLPAQHLIQKVRPWIEAAQSFEKNQLGLGAAFLNSLRLAWCLALLADAAILLRTHALLSAPPAPRSLRDLMCQQTVFDFDQETH